MEPVALIRAGSIRIPIFPHPTKGYQARFYDQDGERLKWTSKDLEKLKERCRTEAKRMQAGTVDLDRLSRDEAALLREVLRRGITMADLDRIAAAPEPVTLSDAVEEFLTAKKAGAGRSERHARNLSGHLRSLVKTIGKRRLLGSVTPREIDGWLSKARSARTRKNWRASAVNFFRWAKRKGMLPEDRQTAAERSEAVRVEATTVEIWTPDELKLMLTNVRIDYLPWIVIQAFAGIRTAELFPEQRAGSRKDPLMWENVRIDRENPFIEVPLTCSKTGDRRIIPVQDNLLAWLKVLHRGSGRVCPPKAPSRRNHGEETIIESLETHLGAWKRNALRHSFGSYRTAQCKNMGEVSLEMGNSVPTIKRHYYEAVTEAEAQQWFSFHPEMIDRSMKAAS